MTWRRYLRFFQRWWNKEPSRVQLDEERKQPEWDDGTLFQRWTFSVANVMINNGTIDALQETDLMLLSRRDSSDEVVNKIFESFKRTKRFWFLPRLIVALYMSSLHDFFWINVWAVLEGAVRVIEPLVIMFLIRALAVSGSQGYADSFLFAGILGGLNVIQTVIHHILFYMSMRMGANWKVGVTGMIFKKLFRLKGLNKIGTGKLVNLISNDVTKFELFSVMSHFFMVSMLELTAVLIILIYELNIPAAFSGVGVSVFFIPVQLYLARFFARRRGLTAVKTDARVRYISEIIDGIATVKSYAWENPWFEVLSELRAAETHSIHLSNQYRAVNMGLFFFAPVIASFCTFTVYWATGGILSIPVVFSTLALLQTLRTTMGRQWTASVESGSEAIASALRIESFLLEPEEAKYAELLDEKNEPTTMTPTTPSTTTEIPLVSISESSYYYGNNEDVQEVVHTTNTQQRPTTPPPTHTPVLRGIHLSVCPGELLMITGPVGSGKSSLLNVLLGEMKQCKHAGVDIGAGEKSKQQGSENSRGIARVIRKGLRTAYCAQRPWILASSVLCNVTLAGKARATTNGQKNHPNGAVDDFKRPSVEDEELYQLAVETTRVVVDMMSWPNYDDTEVGERGVSVSGGQKARIALARAVYSDADLCILDDPLSAVDAHVGSALFFDCIVKALKGRGKGVVLATHQTQYLPYADKILVLSKDGQQTFYGTYKEFQQCSDGTLLPLSSSGVINLINKKSDNSNLEQQEEKEIELGVLKEQQCALHSMSSSGSAVVKYDRSLSHRGTTNKGHDHPTEVIAASNSITIAASATTTTSGTTSKAASQVTPHQVTQVILSEDRLEGSLSTHLWGRYIRAGGVTRGLFAIVVMALSQAALMISEYWLRFWAGSIFWNQNDAHFVWILALITFGCVVLGCYRATSWFQFTLAASSDLHEKSLWQVMHSPMTFFIANPAGRILNRFAKDQSLVDEFLPMTLFDALQGGLFCLAGIILICVAEPWLVLLMPFLLGAFLIVRRKYMKSSMEIKRLEAVSRSPIYADFSAVLEGLVTLRAYNLEQAATASFQRQLDTNIRAWFSFLYVSRWLGFRLDSICAVLMVCVSLVSVALRDTMDVGLLSFAIVYTLSLSGLLQWTVRQSAEVENQMTSVERIASYADLPQEKGYRSTLDSHRQHLVHTQSEQGLLLPSQVKDSTSDIPRGSSTGAGDVKGGGSSIVIKNLSVQYREDQSTPVIHNLSLQIQAGLKVAIVGRTGCGKSTFLQSLLRLNIISQGEIFVDGVSLLHMPLEDARSLVSVIPQDPHLFSGTVRFNLDPFTQYSDGQIWSALEDAHIKEPITCDPKKLNKHVEEGGKNFSVGQRQLLSLARAILRGCAIVLMDEVTASVDYQTDRLIQTTIRTTEALKHATIITVAHRVLTIANSDVVVLLENGGRIGEMGAPWELLQREDSLFYGLAKQSNELEEILRIANAANADAPSTPINPPTTSPSPIEDTTFVVEHSSLLQPSLQPSVETAIVEAKEPESNAWGIIAPPQHTFPPICDGFDVELSSLIDSNHPVLFVIFVFYSFHSAAIKLDARVDDNGHWNVTLHDSFEGSPRVLTKADDRYDRGLLPHTDFFQLLKDFKLISSSPSSGTDSNHSSPNKSRLRQSSPTRTRLNTGPWLTQLLTTLLSEEADNLSYRRFLALLIILGEVLQPRYNKQMALKSLLETMDYSEQLYVILESQLVVSLDTGNDGLSFKTNLNSP